MIENYYMNKLKYNDYLIIMKYGNFYELVGKDALIINKLFNYKLVKLSNTFKVGFPVNKLEENILKIDNLNINYIVFDKEKEIISKSFENNNYFKYKLNEEVIKRNNILINKITKYLKNNIYEDSLDIKLKKIIEVIDE